MSNIIIKAEDISKQYRLGEVSTGTISHDINRWWHKVRGKEDPYLTVGEDNDRTTRGESDYVWALRGVNFEVKQGDVLGIIGRNGAGKSTLLKILSRTTVPTRGEVKIKGRIASLLEVGTGFHPELSGRENIFLNGAILGMSKVEIKRKFDEIVDFAGVERYITTPVKRYSSGMYVRLAFAVAAFLEPEILIVDEVLAVGDAEFQKKCLGRMKDVSNKDGRTVLFVSHNMQAIANLCTSVIVMQQGKIVHSGNTASGISAYISKFLTQETSKEWDSDNAPGNGHARLLKAKVFNPVTGSLSEFDTGSGFGLELEVDNKNEGSQQLDFTYHLLDERGTLVTVGSTATNSEPSHYSKGRLRLKIFFPGSVLNEGIYTFSRILLVRDRGQVLSEWNDVLTFEVFPINRGAFGWQGQKEGVIKIDDIKWEINNQDAN